MAEQTESHGGSAKAGFKKIWAWIQSHPYEAGAVALVLVLLFVWYYFSQPAAAAAPAQQATGSDAATMAAELQQEAINAQQTTALQSQQQAAAVAENQNQTLLNYGSIQAGETLGLAQILADIQGQQITTQGSVDLAGIASNQVIDLANDNAFVQGQSIQAGVGLANIAAQQAINATNAATWLQGTYANDATQALIGTGGKANLELSGTGNSATIGFLSPGPNQLAAEGFTSAQIAAMFPSAAA